MNSGSERNKKLKNNNNGCEKRLTRRYTNMKLDLELGSG